MRTFSACEGGGPRQPGAEEAVRTEAERRASRRRRVMLSGRIADVSGSLVLGCAILDIGASGAQVRFAEGQALPDEVYLIDVKNHIAYEAKVVRKRASLAGLAFKQGHPLAKPLPARLRFLRRLSIDAKLRQIEELTARGFSLEDAIRTAGATRTLHRAWRVEESLDAQEMRRLKKAASRKQKERADVPSPGGAPSACATPERESPPGDGQEAVAAGIAAIAVLSSLLGTLVDNGGLSATQARRVIDGAFPAQENRQANWHAANATATPREYAKDILALLDGNIHNSMDVNSITRAKA